MFGRIFAIPIGQGLDATWGSILPRLFEIQNPTLDYIPWTLGWLRTGTFIGIVLQILLTAFAIFRRDARAIALMAGPPLVAMAFFMLGQKWIVYQMTGCIVPFSACALAGWVREAQLRTHKPYLAAVFKPYLAAVFVLTLVFFAIRLPRTIIPIDRYILHPPAGDQYKDSDINALVAAVGGHVVVVDIDAQNPALVVLLEFGRRNINAQWSAASWDSIVGYRQWPPPVYIAKPELWLGLTRNVSPEGQITFENDRFRLVKLK